MKKNAAAAIIVLAVILAAAAGYFFWRWSRATEALQTVRSQAADLTARVDATTQENRRLKRRLERAREAKAPPALPHEAAPPAGAEDDAKLADRIDALASQIDDLKGRLRASTAEKDGLRERIERLKTDHEQALAQWRRRIESAQAALAEKQRQLAEVRKEASEAAAAVHDARVRLAEKDRLLENAGAKIAEKDRRLAKARAEVEQAKDRLQQETEALESQKAAVRSTYEDLTQKLKKELESKTAAVRQFEDKLSVTFVDRVLFGFSQVTLRSDGKAALDRLAEVLQNLPEGRIRIAGHADSIPIKPEFRHLFPSNWELSSARAAAVARHLKKAAGLKGEKIEVVGYSFYQPVAGNDTAEGRARNRRVEILITPGVIPASMSGQ